MSLRAKKPLTVLERRVGHAFKDPSLLTLALTHRSHAHEASTNGESYERLEFLGDALLGLLVSEWLYHRDASASEGVLSRRRQAIVSTTTLAEAATRSGLGEEVRLGRGEERTGGRGRTSLLADVFEAVLGAVYLDGGMRSARSFVRRHLEPMLVEAGHDASRGLDFKTRLQEELQARVQRTPHYRISSTSGPDHALHFEVEVLLGDESLARGHGASRKAAEQEAAKAALDSFRGGEASEVARGKAKRKRSEVKEG